MTSTYKRYIDISDLMPQDSPDGQLDLDSYSAVRDEMTRIAMSAPGKFGIRSEHRDDRINCLSRIAEHAGHLIRMETGEMYRERVGLPVGYDCRRCGRPSDGCSWSQNEDAGRGDCCPDCDHTRTN